MHSYLHAVVTHAGRCRNANFAELPHYCPVCMHAVMPWRLAASSTQPDDRAVDLALQCPRPECRRVFVASYELGPDGEYQLAATVVEPWQRELSGII